MSLTIQCPQCNHPLSALEQALGKQVSCPKCSHRFVLSAPADADRGEAIVLPASPGGGAATPFGQQPFQTLPSSGFAIASLVLGIISIPSCIFYGLPSLICGILAVIFAKNASRDVAAGRVSPGSASMASAGRICGWIGLGLTAVWGFIIALFIVLAATGNLK